MAQLFGFSIDDSYKKPSETVVSPVPKNNEDGADYYLASGFYGQYLDVEGVFKTEYDLIRRYREMALHPECDSAIEDILCEAIVSDQNDSPIQIDLENLNVGPNIKDLIRGEFQYIKEMLDFDKKSHEIFRNWYVDGRIYYHKVIDLEKPEEGIKELRYIDALKIKYVREQKKKGGANAIQYANNDRPGADSNPLNAEFPGLTEYFIYTPNSYQKNQYGSVAVSGQQKDAIKFARDAIAYCTSGLVDRNKHTVLSYLQKAIKSLNQLRMIEDSLVIYRMSRAPERRIFYIDVGNLPKVKAEQYLREVMMRYRNKLVYDSNSGEIRDDKRMMSMLEDFWLPRREGGRGTEITTLPGGQNLGELADIEYFQKKLYRSLAIPESRIAGSGDGFNLGRSSEIARDELKFSKFVGRLRKRFSNLLLDLLRTQLLLKNIVTPSDWEVMNEHIQFDFLYDNHFAELKDKELLEGRLGLLGMIEPYAGRYYSTEYIRRQVLRQRDQEIVEIDEQIEEEIAKGVLPDPNQQMMEFEQQAAMGAEPGAEGGAEQGFGPGMPGTPEQPPGIQTPAKLPKSGEGEI